jgi:hypothetical protein
LRSTKLAIAAIVLSLLAAACGGIGGDGNGAGSGSTSGPSGSSGGTGAISYPTGADDLVLRVETSGGFVTPQTTLRTVPQVSIFGDGRMIQQGPVTEIYPGQALPNLQQSQLTDAAVQSILAEAEKAGLLGPDADYPYPCISDLPTTVFTVNADGQTHTISAYALSVEARGGASGPTMQCPNVNTEARTQLAEFQRKLGDLASWLPAGSVGAEQPYTPTEMRVYVGPYQGDPQLEQHQIAWPLATPLASFGDPDANLPDLRCGVVSGDDLATLYPDAERANELTPWTSDGDRFALTFRPLLPDEHGC